MRIFFFSVLAFIFSASALADDLPLGKSPWPRVFFFRQSEGAAARRGTTFAEWEKEFAPLMGIMGKALDEEVIGREARNPEFFSQFKKNHPDQAVLLHLNGNARDPRYHADRFFAGHWIHYVGTKIEQNLPATSGEAEIRVADASIFQTEMGRYKNANDDIALCVLNDEGKPDWFRCEQAQLVSINQKENTIRVRRAQYGSKPLAFKKGKAYAAPHVTEGPWGSKNHLLWYYNYASASPRDKQGRSCADAFVADIAEWFGAGGLLEKFDGLEFDVLHHEVGGRGRPLDVNGDGQPDIGVFDGVNTYGVGVYQFCEKLRATMGDDFYLMADGMSERNQRAFGLLNGIESEGWPHLSDNAIDDWSGGLNRHFFWRENARKVVLNYINHKFIIPTGQPGVTARPKVPFSTHRLVFAAGLFTDSALTYAFPSPGPEDVWDEFWKGKARKLGWLGYPKGEAIRLAKSAGSVLDQAQGGYKIEGEGVRFQVDDSSDTMHVVSTDPEATELRFSVSGIPLPGPDLFVTFLASAKPRKGYPQAMPRLVQAQLQTGNENLISAPPETTGIRLRGESEKQLAPESKASVGYRLNTTLGNIARSAMHLHPPYGGQETGYVFWTQTVELPKGKPQLSFYTAMSERAPGRSDGVVFRVEIAPVVSGNPQKFASVFKHHQIASEWVAHSVDLSKWAGEKVAIKCISDAGPKNNATTDQSIWADMFITPEGQRPRPVSVARTYHTFVNAKPFESTFYFRQVSGSTGTLHFSVEGTEPLLLDINNWLDVYAHPDVMAREYDNGLVLANPGDAPFTFELEEMFPGRKWKRITATKGQDTVTNNGEEVGKAITLPARDALFLSSQ